MTFLDQGIQNHMSICYMTLQLNKTNFLKHNLYSCDLRAFALFSRSFNFMNFFHEDITAVQCTLYHNLFMPCILSV